MTGNPWYRVLNPRPNAAKRLIIAPHAGGGPAYYRDWPNHLPESIEVVVIQLPGRANRWKEPVFHRIEPLLAALIPQLQPLLDRPVTLFGHSLGALIAFELALQWSSTNQAIAGLIVAGAAGPQFPRTRTPLYSLTDAALRTELARLGGTPTDLQGNDELFELFLPTLRADLEVLEHYDHHSGPVLNLPMLICGGHADAWATIDQLLGWTEFTNAPCDVQLYSGGHFFVHEQRNRILAEIQRFMLARHTSAADIDLWRLKLDNFGEPAVLSSIEHSRASRFLKPLIRERFVSARSQLRRVLGNYLGIGPGEVALKTTDFGKPFLDPAVHGHDLRFNLSHSENVGLIAISQGHEIGVDVEQIRPQISTADLARRYFSVLEVADLEKLPASEQPNRFFDYWSAKEAYIKARGRGLNIPLDAFDVPIDGGSCPFKVIDRNEPSESGRWQVYPLNVCDGYAAAVCVDRGVQSIRLLNLHRQ